MSFEISPWDMVILIAYVVGTRIAFGWYFALKTRRQGAESYFLAGRSMRWPIIGLSFYVANMSGSTSIGLLWRRASRAGSFLALAVGIPLGIAGWLIVEVFELFGDDPLHFSYFCGIMLAIACGWHVAGSLAWPDELSPVQESCLWRPRLWREETTELRALPWWQNYRVHAILLAACTLAIVAWWW